MYILILFSRSNIQLIFPPTYKRFAYLPFIPDYMPYLMNMAQVIFFMWTVLPTIVTPRMTFNVSFSS